MQGMKLIIKTPYNHGGQFPTLSSSSRSFSGFLAAFSGFCFPPARPDMLGLSEMVKGDKLVLPSCDYGNSRLLSVSQIL